MAVLAALAVVAASCSSGGSDGGSDGEAVEAGSGAGPPEGGSGDLPTHELEMADGSTARLADFVGERPLVLNFFASWCPPCRAEMPDFQAVYSDVREQVGFLGVDLQDSKQAGAALVEETGVEYPWGLDPDGTLYAAFEGFSMPTTVFISADGEVVDKANGALSESQLRGILAERFGVGTGAAVGP